MPLRPPTNINAAPAAEIDDVPGLKGHGHEIERYRGERGEFSSLRQLDEVPGLSGKVDDTIRAHLKL